MGNIVNETLTRLARNACNGEIKNTFARAYIHAIGQCDAAEDLATQLLYVSCNLQSWKGQEARETKLMIKQSIALLQRA